MSNEVSGGLNELKGRVESPVLVSETREFGEARSFGEGGGL